MIVHRQVLDIPVLFHVFPALPDGVDRSADLFRGRGQEVAVRRTDPVPVVVAVGRIEIEGRMASVLLHLHGEGGLLDGIVHRAGEGAGIDVAVIDDVPDRDIFVAESVENERSGAQHGDIEGEIEIGGEMVVSAFRGRASHLGREFPEGLPGPFRRLFGIVLVGGIRAGVGCDDRIDVVIGDALESHPGEGIAVRHDEFLVGLFIAELEHPASAICEP